MLCTLLLFTTQSKIQDDKDCPSNQLNETDSEDTAPLEGYLATFLHIVMSRKH